MLGNRLTTQAAEPLFLALTGEVTRPMHPNAGCLGAQEYSRKQRAQFTLVEERFCFHLRIWARYPLIVRVAKAFRQWQHTVRATGATAFLSHKVKLVCM